MMFLITIKYLKAHHEAQIFVICGVAQLLSVSEVVDVWFS